MNMQINKTKQVSYGTVESVPGNPFNQSAQLPQPPQYAQPSPFNQPEPPVTNIYPSVSNPFAYPNSIQEQIQPNATDAYMHGNVEDRGFREY
jgi:hypothetical protein